MQISKHIKGMPKRRIDSLASHNLDVNNKMTIRKTQTLKKVKTVLNSS